MSEILLRAAIVLIYLITDVLYINLQRHIYSHAVEKVQHKPLNLSVGYGFLAYVAMMLGWLVLVAPILYKSTFEWKASKVILYALGIGAAYGFALYGTFSFTNAALFHDYKGRVVIQDILWGTFSAAFFSVLYVVGLKTLQK